MFFLSRNNIFREVILIVLISDDQFSISNQSSSFFINDCINSLFYLRIYIEDLGDDEGEECQAGEHNNEYPDHPEELDVSFLHIISEIEVEVAQGNSEGPD